MEGGVVMGKGADEARRRAWRERLGRFARSGQTVAAFCAAERVSVPTFYQWKRRLGSEAAGAGRRQADTAPVARCAGAFVPVRIAAGAIVEMELPNGTRVRVPAGDLEAIGAAVAAAGRLPIPAEGEATRC
jgi:hypothetical protein